MTSGAKAHDAGKKSARLDSQDAGSDYRIALTSLPGNPGKTLELHDYLLPLPDTWTNGVVTLREAEGSFEVSLQSLHEGILVNLRGTVPTDAQCSRCLDPVPGTVEVNETQMFFFPGAREAARQEGDEEWEDILEVSADDEVDLEPVLRDALVLGMETLPLCSPDCRGLCPDCGEKFADLPPDHHHEVLDPRWAVLGDLANELRAQEAGGDEAS